MLTPVRYVVLALFILITLHYILSFTNESYGRATSITRISDKLRGASGPPYHTPVPSQYFSKNLTFTPPERKANAAIVILARNGDLQGVINSMKQLEDRFNKKFRYDYVFLNEEKFSDRFIVRTSQITNSRTKYAQIPPGDWFQPSWINETRASEARKKMEEDRVIYGGNLPYRNMCRFNSGFFFRQPVLKDYKYYWRVEPDIKFFCDLDYDPFLYMQDHNKVYGFTVSLYEYEATIPTLWQAVKDFVQENRDLIASDNALAFISDDNGDTFNKCHFWSNFEIGDLDFWRNETYLKYFRYLDEKGGFYYERWGDAPVHSIGAALFARKDQIHFFNDIGYRHEPFQHCPQQEAHRKGKCWCDPDVNFDYDWYSCLNRYDKLFA